MAHLAKQSELPTDSYSILTIPSKAVLLSTGPVESKALLLKSAAKLRAMGLAIFATGGTASHWPVAAVAPLSFAFVPALVTRLCHKPCRRRLVDSIDLIESIDLIASIDLI